MAPVVVVLVVVPALVPTVMMMAVTLPPRPAPATRTTMIRTVPATPVEPARTVPAMDLDHVAGFRFGRQTIGTRKRSSAGATGGNSTECEQADGRRE